MITRVPPSDLPAVPGVVRPRLVNHRVTDFMQGHVARWAAGTGADRLESLIFGVVMAANVSHLPFATTAGAWIGIDAPDELRRPISMAAVAASMNLPVETVRRRAHGAGGIGLLTIGQRGCIVEARVFAASGMRELVRADAAALFDCCRGLAADGHDLARTALSAGGAAVPPSVAARLIIDMSMRAMAPLVERYGDVIDAAICIGLVAANVSHIRADPRLSRTYADYDRPPPDDMRLPVTLRQLARELRLPFETVRRRSAPLVARGELRPVGRGFIVPAAVLAGAAYRRESRTTLHAFDRLARELARLGPGAAAT